MHQYATISRKLASFSFGQIQTAATLLKVLKRHGITVDDFLSFVAEEKRHRIQGRDRMERRLQEIERCLPKCPSCGTPMIFRPAGEDPGDGSHWTCPRCRFGRYDPRGVEKVRRTSSVA